MNNKFIARIAAVAIGATMLSTAVFASGATLSDDKGELNFSDTASENTYVTMMAYATDREVTDSNVSNDSYQSGDAMIALEQVSGVSGLGGAVKIDSSKLSGKKHIVVKIGGGESPASILLSTTKDFAKILDGNAVENEEVTTGEKTYTGIRTKKGEYTPDPGENVNEVGVVFANASNKSEVSITESGTSIVVKWDGEIEGEGKITFGAGLMGVPTDKTVYAFPYVKGTK